MKEHIYDCWQIGFAAFLLFLGIVGMLSLFEVIVSYGIIAIASELWMLRQTPRRKK